jgi:proliferating cell nuclear antigen PCNA
MSDDLEGKTFVAHTHQGASIRAVFEVLRCCLLDAVLVATPDGLCMTALDTTKSAMISLQLRAENFDFYYSKGKNILGICLSNFVKILSSVTTSDILTFCINESDETRLQIIMQNAERKSSFWLRLMILQECVVEIPASTFNVVIVLASSEFQRLMRDMSGVAEAVEIKTNKLLHGLDFQCSGDYCEQLTTIVESKNSSIHRAEEEAAAPNDGDDAESSEEEVFGTFSLKFLHMFSKSASVSQTVDLYLKSGLLVLSYKVSALGTLNFLLAPLHCP